MRVLVVRWSISSIWHESSRLEYLGRVFTTTHNEAKPESIIFETKALLSKTDLRISLSICNWFKEYVSKVITRILTRLEKDLKVNKRKAGRHRSHQALVPTVT
jgi:hypothetical protein